MRLLPLAGLLLLAAALTYFFGPIAPALGIIAALGVGIWHMATRVQRQPWMLLAVMVCAILILASPALAQGTTVDVGGIFGQWRQTIADIVGTVIAGFVGWVLAMLRSKFNLEIEEKHRDALQTALTNAAGLAIAKAGDALAGKTIDVKHPLIAEAVNYVLKGAPDALKYFGITPARIAEMLAAKIPQVGTAPTA